MRKSYVVDLDEAMEALQDILLEYGDEAGKVIDAAIVDTAKEAQVMVSRLSPRSSGSGGALGHYADGWEVEITRPAFGRMEAEIYQSKKPQLAHLLEKGHAKRGGHGRVDGIPHISTAQNSANAHLVTSVIQRLDE